MNLGVERGWGGSCVSGSHLPERPYVFPSSEKLDGLQVGTNFQFFPSSDLESHLLQGEFLEQGLQT